MKVGEKYTMKRWIAAGIQVATLLILKGGALSAPDTGAEPPAVQGREIVVEASMLRRNPVARPGVEPVGLGASISTVSSNTLARMRPTTVTDALVFAPGSWTETRGRKVKQFTSFRGQTYPYPDYALDGLWFREFHELPYFFPAAELERIEVVRSSAALLKGNSGLAGVINLVPRRYDTRHTYLEVEAGEFDTLNGYLTHYEPMGRGGLRVGLGHSQTDGPKAFGAERRETLSLGFDQRLSDEVEVEAYGFVLDGERELVPADAPAGGRFRNSRESFDPVQSVIGALRLRYRPDERKTTELSVWGSDRRAEFKQEDTTTGGHTSHDDDDYEYGAQILQALTLGQNNILRVMGLYHHWVAPDGKRYFTGRRADIETLAAAVVDEHTWDNLTVDAGVRVAREHINEFGGFAIEGSGRGFGDVAPIIDDWAEPLYRANVGLRYAATDRATLYGNYAYGEVDPRDGAMSPDGRMLDAEQRHTLDGGVQITGGWIEVLKLGGFYVWRNDAIRLSGGTYVDPSGLELEYYENRDSEQYGVELECRTRPLWGHAGLFADGLFMQSRVADDAGDMQDDAEIPDEVINAGVYLDVGRTDLNVFAKYVGSYENNRFAADGEPKPLGDYVDIGITAGITLGRERRTRLYAKVQNVTNDEYSTVVGYYDAGRRVSAGVQHSF